MPRVWICALVVSVALLLGLTSGTSASAEQGAVAVACPSLGVEPQSALAARAEADLLVRGTGGKLSIVCTGSSATLTFLVADGPGQPATLPLPPEPRAAIERILEALDELLPRAPSWSAPAAAPPPPVLAPLPPVALPPAPQRLMPPPPVQQEERTEDWDRAGVELGAGVETELWSSAAAGALGPRLGLSWAPEPVWALRLSGGPSWGLRAPEGVSGFLLRLEVGAEVRFGPERSFRLAATVLGDRLAAASDDQSTSDFSPGGVLRASYGAWLGGVRLSGGPLLVLHPGAVRVELGARELYRIPAVTGGLAVEVSFAPWEER